MAAAGSGKPKHASRRAGHGGLGSAATSLVLAPGAGPFLVTTPDAAVSLAGGSQLHMTSTPNNGGKLVALQAVSSKAARIKVEAVGNVCFDVSNANFTINRPASPAVPGRCLAGGRGPRRAGWRAASGPGARHPGR